MCPVHEVDGKSYRFIGVNSRNNKWWMLADLACIMYNVTSVCLYDTLGPDVIYYILNETEMESILLEAK
jgi:long-chain acyl-CoA synthetase